MVTLSTDWFVDDTYSNYIFFKPFTIILIFLTWQWNLLDRQEQDKTRSRPNTKGNSYSSTVVAFHDEIELFNHPADSI